MNAERVTIVTLPPDCDLDGPWEVVEEFPLPGGDSHVRLRQGNSYIGTQRSNVRAVAQPTTPLPTDRDEIYRAVVEAAARALPESQERQALAWRIAEDAVARLYAAAVRCWTGPAGDSCWTCQRPRSEHAGAELRCPAPAAPPADWLSALITAYRASGAKRLSLTEHAGWLHIAVQSPDTAGAEAVGRICAALGAPPPELAEDRDYTWLRSSLDPASGVTVSITGNWRARPRAMGGGR